MRLVGLTGGIASGKSTVSNLFKDAGVPVVDADVVARNVVQKGTGGWKKIVKAFGDEILLDNGEIDRARLGQIVFSDPSKRQLLNRLLAPHISSGIFWEIAKLWMEGCKVIVLDIPLLFETKMDRWTNPVIVVWVNPETQIERLMSRDGCSEEQAQNRINAQLALDWKKSEADIVIDNSGSLDDTKQQFQEVLRKVSEPLTWKECLRSRDGLISVVMCTTCWYYLLRRTCYDPHKFEEVKTSDVLFLDTSKNKLVWSLKSGNWMAAFGTLSDKIKFCSMVYCFTIETT